MSDVLSHSWMRSKWSIRFRDLEDEGTHVVVEVKQSRAIDVQDGVERMPAPGWESYEDENGKRERNFGRTEKVFVCPMDMDQ